MTNVKKSNVKEIPDQIKKMVNKIRVSCSPEKIILFGSYSTGKITFNSDVDLLVVLNTDLRGAERIRMISRLIYPRSLPVDIIVKTPDEIEKSKKRIDPFINDILETGIELYARS